MDNEISETVYGTHEDSHATMSERVQTLAASIYKEFERMIKTYDENVVKELMPLVVGILEGLDQSYLDKQENEVELELLRDDNEQLLTQYEREKQLRKGSEQKFLEAEDATEEERKDTQSKVESLESIVRMFELKAKNAQDHISRLDDKEQETRKEYNKLHERYTELFKTHMDYMERTKILMGGDRIMDSASTPAGKGKFHLPLLRQVTPVGGFPGGETPAKSGSSPPGSFSAASPGRPQDSHASLRSELKETEPYSKDVKESKNKSVETAEKGAETDNVQLHERSTGTKAAEPATPTQEPVATPAAIQPESTESSIVQNGPITETVAGVDMPDAARREAPLDASTPSHAGPLTFTEPMFETFGDGDILPPSSDSLAPTPDVEFMDPAGFGQTGPVNIRGRQNESSIFDEISFQDHEMITDVDDGVDITGNVVTPGEYSSSGMGREVENLILENTELLATKNALNVVKDDLIAKVDELSSEQEILREEIMSLQAVKTKLKARVSELEEELKKFKADLEKAKQHTTGGGEDEDDVPMAQRKRFTRVEMARVLMERNQYKERLMELQEAVRWTEMIRASREHPELVHSNKKRSSIWNFFSNLFSTSNKPAKKPSASATVRYNAPTTQVRPVGDPNKTQRDNYNLGEKAKAYDFLQDDLLAEKKRKERERERREQYKAVQVHVKKDDGRMQAYGWSLPAKFNPPTSKDAPDRRNQVPVPVPVYCRPLLEREPGMKIWCAAGVNLSGGRTRDGGSVVGASVFYSTPQLDESKSEDKDDVEKLNQELKEHEQSMQQREQLSSLVWICTTTHQSSRVTVIDANSPADILETFHVTSSPILCIASVPGADEADYPADDEALRTDLDVTDPGRSPKPSPTHSTGSSGGTDSAQDSGIGSITFVQCATGTTSSNVSQTATPVGTPPKSDLSEGRLNMASISHAVQGLTDAVDPVPEDETIHAKVIKATGSPALSATSTPVKAAEEGGSGEKAVLRPVPALVKDGLNSVPTDPDNDILHKEVQKMESLLPTMWLGSQSGSLYVHSAVSQWRRCLHSVKLKDSVLSIVHVKGRVLVALADGTVAVFHRAPAGQWDLTNYHLVDLGRPHHSIRCMCVVASKHVWCGYRNKIHVLDPKTLKVEKSFDAHPRKESQVRQLAWVGDGVWVSIRLDSTLRLYNAITYQHLQDVDIEPYVSKMLGTGKLGFSFVRITSLLISCSRLWIGTGNGVIISVPLSETNKQTVMTATAGRPGGVIRVYSDTKTDSVTPGSFVPYCSMAQAQLSFHGHRDAVKFFAAVPGAPARGLSAASAPPGGAEKSDDKPAKPASKNVLVISGGEGYIDFRIGESEDDENQQPEVEAEEKSISKGDRSHLIVWHDSC